MVNGVTFGWVNTALVGGPGSQCGAGSAAGWDQLLQQRVASDVLCGSALSGYLQPGAGAGRCWLSGSAGCSAKIEFLDGSTVLATVTVGTVPQGYFYDAQGTQWSAANWPSSNRQSAGNVNGHAINHGGGNEPWVPEMSPRSPMLGITQASGAPNFAISASPASLSVAQGYQGTSSITTTVSGGFNSAIRLSTRECLRGRR